MTAVTASVSASFETLAQAEAGAARLGRLGSGVWSVRIERLDEEEAPREGVFDAVARLIAPQAAGGAAGAYQLTAQLAPERVEEAARLLEDRRIELRSWAGTGDGAELMAERCWNFGVSEERLEVGTRASVREEIVLRRELEERVETIDDTVRRTRVEVEELPPSR